MHALARRCLTPKQDAKMSDLPGIYEPPTRSISAGSVPLFKHSRASRGKVMLEKRD